MTLAARKTESTVREQPRQGTHVARLLGIVEMGHQPGFIYEGKKVESEWKLEFTYELVDHLMEDGRPFVVSEDLTNKDWEDKKTGKSCTLVARAKSMLNEDYRKGVDDMSVLLGQACMVSVTPNAKGYMKVKGIAAVSGVPFGMKVTELYNTPYLFNQDEPDMELWETFPEFKQERIKSALNFPETVLAKNLAEENQYA